MSESVSDQDRRASAPATEWVGMLVDGEFIPVDIWKAHLPVALPPGTVVRALYAEDLGQ